MLSRGQKAFTVAELLIVIGVLGIIATLVGLSWNNANRQAVNLHSKSDIKYLEEQLELYAYENDGAYPATTDNTKSNWKSIDVRTDANCPAGSAQSDWIPELEDLPQSDQGSGGNVGVDGDEGCYLYASNGNYYVLSAWNMVSEPHQLDGFYRRIGFRTFLTPTSEQFYTCNENVTGGANSGYDITQDYYKHSYTISNVDDCDETPPVGA